jgi:hypothetical protein
LSSTVSWGLRKDVGLTDKPMLGLKIQKHTRVSDMLKQAMFNSNDLIRLGAKVKNSAETDNARS